MHKYSSLSESDILSAIEAVLARTEWQPLDAGMEGIDRAVATLDLRAEFRERGITTSLEAIKIRANKMVRAGILEKLPPVYGKWACYALTQAWKDYQVAGRYYVRQAAPVCSKIDKQP